MKLTVLLAIALAAPSVVAAQPASCPDPVRALLDAHETARRAHMAGDAALLTAGMADRLLLVEDGTITATTRDAARAKFAGYFGRVSYRAWDDRSPPQVTVSADRSLAWMAVEIEGAIVPRDPPGAAEQRFRSSWIATYARAGCDWQMTAIASAVVDLAPGGGGATPKD